MLTLGAGRGAVVESSDLARERNYNLKQEKRDILKSSWVTPPEMQTRRLNARAPPKASGLPSSPAGSLTQTQVRRFLQSPLPFIRSCVVRKCPAVSDITSLPSQVLPFSPVPKLKASRKRRTYLPRKTIRRSSDLTHDHTVNSLFQDPPRDQECEIHLTLPVFHWRNALAEGVTGPLRLHKCPGAMIPTLPSHRHVLECNPSVCCCGSKPFFWASPWLSISKQNGVVQLERPGARQPTEICAS